MYRVANVSMSKDIEIVHMYGCICEIKDVVDRIFEDFDRIEMFAGILQIVMCMDPDHQYRNRDYMLRGFSHSPRASSALSKAFAPLKWYRIETKISDRLEFFIGLGTNQMLIDETRCEFEGRVKEFVNNATSDHNGLEWQTVILGETYND